MTGICFNLTWSDVKNQFDWLKITYSTGVGKLQASVKERSEIQESIVFIPLLLE